MVLGDGVKDGPQEWVYLVETQKMVLLERKPVELNVETQRVGVQQKHFSRLETVETFFSFRYFSPTLTTSPTIHDATTN